MAQIDSVKNPKTEKKGTAALAERFEHIINQLDQQTGGWVGIARQSSSRFLSMRGFEAAASLAYYALFSLFPLTLVLAALLGFFFRGEIAYTRAVGFILTVFPFSGELIDRELREIFTQMGTFGILGVFGLLWAASGYFTVLARVINLAWPSVKLRGMMHNRLVAMGMLGGLVILMLFSVLTSMLIGLMPVFLNFIGGNSLTGSPGWILGLRLFSAIFTYAVFIAVYRWVPNKTVSWKSVLVGALIATIAWEMARLLFTLFLASGLARFQFVYGSLGALIALMVWIYFSNSIVLFGAYLVATLDLRAEQNALEEEIEPVATLEDELDVLPEEKAPGTGPVKGIRG